MQSDKKPGGLRCGAWQSSKADGVLSVVLQTEYGAPIVGGAEQQCEFRSEKGKRIVDHQKATGSPTLCMGHDGLLEPVHKQGREVLRQQTEDGINHGLLVKSNGIIFRGRDQHLLLKESIAATLNRPMSMIAQHDRPYLQPFLGVALSIGALDGCKKSKSDLRAKVIEAMKKTNGLYMVMDVFSKKAAEEILVAAAVEVDELNEHVANLRSELEAENVRCTVNMNMTMNSIAILVKQVADLSTRENTANAILTENVIDLQAKFGELQHVLLKQQQEHKKLLEMPLGTEDWVKDSIDDLNIKVKGMQNTIDELLSWQGDIEKWKLEMINWQKGTDTQLHKVWEVLDTLVAVPVITSPPTRSSAFGLAFGIDESSMAFNSPLPCSAMAATKGTPIVVKGTPLIQLGTPMGAFLADAFQQINSPKQKRADKALKEMATEPNALELKQLELKQDLVRLFTLVVTIAGGVMAFFIAHYLARA